MRKISFLLVLALSVFSFLSCGKKENGVQAAAKNDTLSVVLQNVSPECRESIRMGSTAAFLEALDKVLKSDSVSSFDSNSLNDKLKMFVICDRDHPISELYIPSELETLQINQFYNICSDSLRLKKNAEKALRRMGEASRLENITLIVKSGYRSYSEQKAIYDELLSSPERVGISTDDFPGTSEHQTGYAVDFLDSGGKASEWLSENAHKYGWSMTYSSNSEYNPLHYRYLGVEACRFQRLWFGGSQRLMLEFIAEWRRVSKEGQGK